MELFITLFILLVFIAPALFLLFKGSDSKPSEEVKGKGYEELADDMVGIAFKTFTSSSLSDQEFDSLVLQLRNNIDDLPEMIKRRAIKQIYISVAEFYSNKISGTEDTSLFIYASRLKQNKPSLDDLFDFVCEYRLSKYCMIEISFDVNGIKHRTIEDQIEAAKLMAGNGLSLVKDPDNVHDHNAVKVMSGEYHIGYVERQCSEQISILMKHPHECLVSEIISNDPRQIRAKAIFDTNNKEPRSIII